MTRGLHLARIAAAAALAVVLLATAGFAEASRASQPAGQVDSRPSDWGSLSIPGTAAGLLEAVGLDQNVSRTRLMLEVIRRAYESPDDDAARARESLREYISLVAEFEQRLQQAGGVPLVITPERLRSPDSRRRLEPLLAFLGYRVRTGSRGATVEPTLDQSSASRRTRLRSAGVDVDDLDRRLSSGEARLELPRFSVPLPLGPEAWRRIDAGLGRRPPLYLALLGARRAALLYAGLCSVDEDTLQALATAPGLLQQLHDESAAAFAAFGGSLRLREGRVAVPGDEDAVRIWEALAGEPVTIPGSFVPALFARDRGRLAYFLETIAALDVPRQRFALAAFEVHPGRRRERVESLYAVFEGFDAGWQPTARPFTRRPCDPARWLAELRVSEEGAFIGPRARRLWERAFDGADLSPEARMEVEDAEAGEAIDAAWLAARVFSGPPTEHPRRLELTLFSQRVFAGARSDDGDLLVALRGYLRFPTLSLTLERLSLKEASLHAAAARRADMLMSVGSGARAAMALVQFQAALFLVERCAFAGALEADALPQIVRQLLSVDPDDGRYRGRLAEWVQSVWMPAIGADEVDTEAGLIAAVAGARHRLARATGGTPPAVPVLEWEGERYELDPVTPEIQRIDRIREGQGGSRLEQVLDLAGGLRVLEAGPIDRERAGELDAMLGRAPEALRRPTAVAGVTGDDLPDPAEVIAEVREQAARAASGGGAVDARTLLRLSWTVDVLLTDVLVSIAYAVVLGDPAGPVVRSGHVAARHDPGLTVRPAERDLPTAWELARSVQGGGRGWSARGSVLLLDIGLAALGVRRLAGDSAPPAGGPAVPGTVLVSLERTLALWNPFALDDRSRDEIASGLLRGRAQVEALRRDAAALDAALADAGVEAGRRHLLGWAARHEPEEVTRLLALVDLLALGRADGLAMPRAWATEAISRSGCVCLDVATAPGPLERGRPSTGILGAYVTDLGLRLAEVTYELNLPGGLAHALLAGAVYDFAFDAAPLHDDDWLGLVRGVDAVSRERIEEYVAVLTFDGPLTAMGARLENGR